MLRLSKICFVLLLTFFFSCKPKTKPINNVEKHQKDYKAPISTIKQNLTHLKAGDMLEIKIETVPLAENSRLEVKVGGIPIPVESDGIKSVAVYVTKVHGAFGEHTIPITVTHVDKKGTMVDNHIVSYFIDK